MNQPIVRLFTLYFFMSETVTNIPKDYIFRVVLSAAHAGTPALKAIAIAIALAFRAHFIEENYLLVTL